MHLDNGRSKQLRLPFFFQTHVAYLISDRREAYVGGPSTHVEDCGHAPWAPKSKVSLKSRIRDESCDSHPLAVPASICGCARRAACFMRGRGAISLMRSKQFTQSWSSPSIERREEKPTYLVDK